MAPGWCPDLPQGQVAKQLVVAPARILGRVGQTRARPQEGEEEPAVGEEGAHEPPWGVAEVIWVATPRAVTSPFIQEGKGPYVSW